MRCALVTVALLAVLARPPAIWPQELAPRAYDIAPIGANYLTLSNAYNTGGVFTDPAVPVEDAKARFNVATISIYHSLSLFGRTANITALLPYVIGQFSAEVNGSSVQASRSGTSDARVRVAVNLLGGPAVMPEKFAGWREGRLLGVSLTVVTPNGQYDPARLINLGYNRWAFRPEVGYSTRLSRWSLDVYGGVWFYTSNSAYYPGGAYKSQTAVYSGEAHLSYSVRPRLWISADGNFWAGGRSIVNGLPQAGVQRNSRGGATVSVPLTKHWAAKASFSSGVYIPIGGDFRQATIGLQYGWIGSHWR